MRSCVAVAALLATQLVASTTVADETKSEQEETVESADLPPLDMPVRSQTSPFTYAGIILVGLGAFSVLGGGLVVRAAAEDNYTDDELTAAGVALLAGGAASMTVGIPLWIYGAVSVKHEVKPRSTTVRVRWRF